MLTKKVYISLLNNCFYNDIFSLYKKTKIICFVNFSFRLDQKLLVNYQVFLYFFLSLFWSQSIHILCLTKSYPRLGYEKGYPLGCKVNIKDSKKFYNFIYYFNKWFYYNIFGDLKQFFLDKFKGTFFGIKFPFLNLFYFFDYNIITLFLFNLNIPNFKLFISTTSDKYENITLKNFYGFH
jgi:hypothetical protein